MNECHKYIVYVCVFVCVYMEDQVLRPERPRIPVNIGIKCKHNATETDSKCCELNRTEPNRARTMVNMPRMKNCGKDNKGRKQNKNEERTLFVIHIRTTTAAMAIVAVAAAAALATTIK